MAGNVARPLQCQHIVIKLVPASSPCLLERTRVGCSQRRALRGVRRLAAGNVEGCGSATEPQVAVTLFCGR
jgi:hypothetical protein